MRLLICEGPDAPHRAETGLDQWKVMLPAEEFWLLALGTLCSVGVAMGTYAHIS